MPLNKPVIRWVPRPKNTLLGEWMPKKDLTAPMIAVPTFAIHDPTDFMADHTPLNRPPMSFFPAFTSQVTAGAKKFLIPGMTLATSRSSVCQIVQMNATAFLMGVLMEPETAFHAVFSHPH